MRPLRRRAGLPTQTTEVLNSDYQYTAGCFAASCGRLLVPALSLIAIGYGLAVPCLSALFAQAAHCMQKKNIAESQLAQPVRFAE